MMLCEPVGQWLCKMAVGAQGVPYSGLKKKKHSHAERLVNKDYSVSALNILF